MASSQHPSASSHNRRPSRNSIASEEDALGATTRQLEAFSRKVTATAGHLMGPLAGEAGAGVGSMTAHYQNALGDLQRGLRRPMLQRSVYSLAQTRNNLLASAPEIHRRALAHVPEELLAHVPESSAPFSLFDGFQASVEDGPLDGDADRRGRKHRKARNARGQKLVGAASEEMEEGERGLQNLRHERDFLDRRLDMMGVRKSMCSSEIREIDIKVANLTTLRKTVMERLAGLENEEMELEHELLELDNSIDDAEAKLRFTTPSIAVDPSTIPLPAGDTTPTGSATPPSGPMSESIYASPNSPANANASTPRRGRRASRRIHPVLHEHMEPGSLIREIPAHSDAITALGFDAPFGTLVTASMDDTLRVWDLNAGRCLGMLEGHLSSARAIQVEDSLVASGAMDATVRLWDLSHAEYLPRESGSNVSKTQQQSQQADLTNIEEDDVDPPPAVSLQNCALFSLTGHVAEVTALHFHADTLVSGGADRTLRQWDLETGRCVQTLDVLWAAAQSSVPSVSSPPASDSRWRTSAASTADTTVDFVGALQVYGAALAVGFSDSMIRLFDLRSGKVHRSLVGHTGPVTALQFDDLHLVTASQDRSVRIWDLRTGTIFDAYAYDAPITSMSLDDRRIVSAAGESVVKVFDKPQSSQWDCGPGMLDEQDPSRRKSAIVDRVRIRDGFAVEGRRDGMVGVWSC